MLEQIIFELIAIVLLIIMTSKAISKKDLNYLNIVIIQLIGLIISFIGLAKHSSFNIVLATIRYVFSIVIPLAVILIEFKGYNFSEILYISRIKLCMRFNNYKKAKNILIKLVTKYPESYNGHKLLAQIYEKEGGMRKAIDEYVKAVDIKRNDDKSYFKIANLLNELGQKNEAIQMLESLLKTKPDSYDGAVLLGNLLCEESRFKEAEKVYQNILKFYPADFDLYYSLGIVYTMLNEFQMAKETYEMAAKINHLAYSANYNLGQIALILGDFDQAEKYFEKSMYEELEPISYYQLAKIFVLRGDNNKAIIFLNKAIELDPKLLQKANKDKIFENIRNLITVSVKMGNDDEKVKYNRSDKKKNKFENMARKYLESTNSLIRDINENSEKEKINKKVDEIFEENLVQKDKITNETEIEPKELDNLQ